jgi:hypothetical protein
MLAPVLKQKDSSNSPGWRVESSRYPLLTNTNQLAAGVWTGSCGWYATGRCEKVRIAFFFMLDLSLVH